MLKVFQVNGLDIPYETVYRDILYPRLEYKTGSLLLVLPKGTADEEKLLQKYGKWICSKEAEIKRIIRDAESININISDKTEQELQSVVRKVITKAEEDLRVKSGKVIFRPMNSKWGSYSKKGNITLNTLLRYLPDDLIEYIVYHELTHSIERRHNHRFWKLIGSKYQDYATMEKKLFTYWFALQRNHNINPR